MTPRVDLASIERCERLIGLNPSGIRELFAEPSTETPQLVLSRSEVRRNMNTLKSALPRAEIFYAVKSNNHAALAAEVRAVGGNFDVCSAEEITTVGTTGVPPHTLLHTHPVKALGEFDRAVEAGVRTFVVDNISEVAKLRRYPDLRLKVLVRFRVHINTTAVVNLQYKFGCTIDEVPSLAAAIEDAGHEFHGLCFHIGSQCIYSENYVAAIRAAGELTKRLAEQNLHVRLLDMGGGFPVEYVEPVPPIEVFCEPINRALDDHLAPDIRVICEPGRFISATAVTLVTRIIGKAMRDGKLWYYLDDGLYSTFSGIVFDHCQYPVITNREGEEKLSVLAGPTCDSFDTLYDGLMIPEHEIGDSIVFPRTGAYCSVSGSTFNSLPQASYRVVD
jgi:ornithine decarboxylase